MIYPGIKQTGIAVRGESFYIPRYTKEDAYRIK